MDSLRKLTLRCIHVGDFTSTDLSAKARSRKPTSSSRPLEVAFLENCSVGAPFLQEVIRLRPNLVGLETPCGARASWHSPSSGGRICLPPKALQCVLQPASKTLQHLTIRQDDPLYHDNKVTEVIRLDSYSTLKRLSVVSTCLNVGNSRLTNLQAFHHLLPPTLEHLIVHIPAEQHWVKSLLTEDAEYKIFPRPAPDCSSLLDLLAAKARLYPSLTSVCITETLRIMRENDLSTLEIVDLPDDVIAASKRADVMVSISLVQAKPPQG